MKAAGHELKGLKAYYSIDKEIQLETGESLHFPFMALISYRGYRLIASPQLPINSTSLIYGSNDAGKTVHASDVNMNKLMKNAAERLCIKEHLSGIDDDESKLVPLNAPADIEGHKGWDGRYYLLDTVPNSTAHHSFLFNFSFLRRGFVPLSPLAKLSLQFA
jgi:hypothetical protein